MLSELVLAGTYGETGLIRLELWSEDGRSVISERVDGVVICLGCGVFGIRILLSTITHNVFLIPSAEVWGCHVGVAPTFLNFDDCKRTRFFTFFSSIRHYSLPLTPPKVICVGTAWVL